VCRNQTQVQGAAPAWRSHWRAYAVFREFARSLTESMEQWGPRPKPIALEVTNHHLFEAALAEGRGLVVLTGHFGSWEVGARFLARLGRRVHLVTATDPNPTVRGMLHEMRTRHGFDVIYSDRSLLTGLPILQALRRDEIVCLQIEPWGPLPGTQPVTFCGRTTYFQLGPFEIARVAKAPIVPVFARRTGIRAHELRVEGRFDPRTREDSVRALEATVAAYERLVRAHPAQWLMFQDVWAPEPARALDGATVPAPSRGGSTNPVGSLS
jgi:KDO2-lipid IV(A) lauroyltransferase